MTDKDMKAAMVTIAEIKERLDAIEDMTAWLVRTDQRFKKGQRVQFSPAADRKGISARIKGGVRRGTIVGLDSVGVTVLLDGYKKPQGFHHSFFEKIGRKRQTK